MHRLAEAVCQRGQSLQGAGVRLETRRLDQAGGTASPRCRAGGFWGREACCRNDNKSRHRLLSIRQYLGVELGPAGGERMPRLKSVEDGSVAGKDGAGADVRRPLLRSAGDPVLGRQVRLRVQRLDPRADPLDRDVVAVQGARHSVQCGDLQVCGMAFSEAGGG